MTLEWTKRGQEDLWAAYAYIATDQPEAAERVTREILNAVRGLEEFPLKGRHGQNPRVRELVVGRYVIVYAVRRTRILIVRVWHGAQRR